MVTAPQRRQRLPTLKRHRWKKTGEHRTRCKDCLLERHNRPIEGSNRWATDWTWVKPNSGGQTFRRTNGATPTCPPSPDDFEVTP